MKLLLSLVFIAQGQQADEAAELLKKAEANITQAKSLHFKATLKRTEEEVETHCLEVEGWLKGDKAKLKYGGKIESADASKTITSAHTGTPKTYAEATRAVLFRAGAFFPVFVIDDGDDLREVFAISELKLCEDEKTGDRVARVLTFSLTTLGAKKPSAVKVWLDKESLVPIKRTTLEPNGAVRIETFTSWALDEDLGDEVFKK